MKALIRGTICALVVLGLSTGAQASHWPLILDPDETTNADVELIQGALATAADGSEVSKSLRKVTMGVVGELQLLLRSRMDEAGNLKLDVGSLVALLDGDTISAESRARPGARLVFECRRTPEGHTICRPVCLVVVSLDGTVRIEMSIPPRTVRRCPVEGCVEPLCPGPVHK